MIMPRGKAGEDGPGDRGAERHLDSMPLEPMFIGMKPVHVRRLKGLGLADLHDLADLVSRPERIQEVADRVGVSVVTFRKWVDWSSKAVAPRLPNPRNGEQGIGVAPAPLSVDPDLLAIWERHYAMRAAEIAGDQVLKRETRWRAYVTIGITFFAILTTVLGLFGFNDLRKSLDDSVAAKAVEGFRDLSESVTRVVTDGVRQELGQLVQASVLEVKTEAREDRDFYRFLAIGQEFGQLDDAFTNTQRDAAAEALRSISRVDRLVRTSAFEDALEKVIDAFIAAGLDEHVDEIDEILSEDPSSEGVITSFVQHYGRRLLGVADDRDEAPLLKRFERWASAAHKKNYGEFARPFDFVHRFRRTGRQGSLDQDVSGVQALDPGEIHTFLKILSANSHVSRITNSSHPDGSILRVVSAVTEFRRAYREELGQLRRHAASELGSEALGEVASQLEEAVQGQNLDARTSGTIEDILMLFSSTEIIQTDAYQQAVANVLRVLLEAKEHGRIDDLEDVLSEDIDARQEPFLSESPVVLWLCVHYGVRAVGREQNDEGVVERFTRYAASARATNYPELALPFEAALAFREADLQRGPSVDRLLVEVAGLEPEEIGTFLQQIEQRTASSRGDSTEENRAAAVFAAFVEEYAQELEDLRQP